MHEWAKCNEIYEVKDRVKTLRYNYIKGALFYFCFGQEKNVGNIAPINISKK